MGRRKSKSKHRKPKRGKKVASSSAPPPPPPWIELPGDITANILQRLGSEEILESAQKVCTTWRRVCQDPAMWRVIDLIGPDHMHADYDKMCRHAVDRSQGQLVDLSLIFFGEDELIYVAERSSRLRRLNLSGCSISGKALVEAVKKFPVLEELHLIITPSVQAADIEAIGISCPMLTSFTFLEELGFSQYSSAGEVQRFGNSDCALAIAKTMPNLRHLRLVSRWMENEGLLAILDGCPRLESLDISQCYNLDLEGDLGKRCCEQIKDLKRPSNSISDTEGFGTDDEWEDGPSYDSDVHSFGCSDRYYEQYDDFINDDDDDDDETGLMTTSRSELGTG